MRSGLLVFWDPMSRRAVPREETIRAIEHAAAMPNGAVTLGAGHLDLHDLADRIKNGDPLAGWEGDPRLTLAFYRDPKGRGSCYELWRLEHDGEYRMVARLAGDLNPSGIIRKLVEHDARRGYDVHEAVSRHNAKIDREKTYQSDQVIGEHGERLAGELLRAAGIKTQF